MQLLDFEAIRQAQDLDEQEVEIPEWGGSVQVRGLSRAEVFAATRAATVADELDPSLFDVEVISRAVVKPEIERAGWEELCRAKSFAAVERLAQAILKVSGMGPEPAKTAEALFRR